MLALDINLLDGRYDAAEEDKSAPEWPPHPARAFCALVAGARDDADWAALRWLEQQQPPDVLAGTSIASLARGGFVVANRTDKGGGSQFHLGRTNALKARIATQPSSSRVRFEWTAAEASTEVYDALDRLALRMPYLGRSTSHVIATFDTAGNNNQDELLRYRPETEQTTGLSVLRVPSPGYLDRLRASYDDDQPAWSVQTGRVGYRSQTGVAAPVPATVDSPFRELAVLGLPGLLPDGRLAARFTEALRAAMLDRVPDPLPPALHGHGADDVAHVAFVALPFAGLSPHADGHLVALALAVPEMPADHRRAILRALVAPDNPEHQWNLRVPGIQSTVQVQYLAAEPATKSARPERWTDPSTTWVSVTPFAFDRHPKKGDDWAELIARSCELAGYPRPTQVEISRAPLTPGGIRMTAHDLPERLRTKLIRHVRMRFAAPVRGPMLVGAGRYLGIGLFAPETGTEPAS